MAFSVVFYMQVTVFAQFTEFKNEGQNILIQVFDLIKWIGLSLGVVYGGVNGLKMFNDREDKMDIIKKIIWIPFAILILFGIPELIKLVTGENPLE